MDNYYKTLLEKRYSDLILYLKQKYGVPNSPYFLNESCKTPNNKIKRLSEGLFIHHTYENLYPDLSKRNNPIVLNDFSLQKDLVYCDYLEHFILHLVIIREFTLKRFHESNGKYIVGIGGLINFLIPIINDLYLGYNLKRENDIKAFDLIKNKYNDYVELLNYCYCLSLDNSTTIVRKKDFKDEKDYKRAIEERDNRKTLSNLFFICYFTSKSNSLQSRIIDREKVFKSGLLIRKKLDIKFSEYRIKNIVVK